MDDLNNSMDKIRAWREEMLLKFGWFAEHTFHSNDYPMATNSHTHGLLESCNHPDLQVCLNIDRNQIQDVFHAIANEIIKGNKFQAGKTYLGILNENYPVRFMEARESGRKVLRVLLPDENGGFDSPPYHLQATKPDDGQPLHALFYCPDDIRQINDVLSFMAAVIVDHDLNFHPDNRFEDYVQYEDGKAIFTPAQADILDQVMDQCFTVCGHEHDIYEYAIKIINTAIELKNKEVKEDPAKKVRRGKKK